MSDAARKPMTLAAFLEWEERQDLRYEFDGAQVLAMTGGTLAHAVVTGNLHLAVGARLRGGPCRLFSSDVKITTARTSRYPDAVVTYGTWNNADTVLAEPVVIFEVLSRSTASTDHITKNAEYASIASVRRYVMLEQERIGATVFSCTEAGWRGEIVAAGDVLAMPEIGVSLPLSELYEGLEFAPEVLEPSASER